MFADWAPYLVANKRSLEDLNTRLEKPLTEMSFRPNILVETAQAFDEVCTLSVLLTIFNIRPVGVAVGAIAPH